MPPGLGWPLPVSDGVGAPEPDGDGDPDGEPDCGDPEGVGDGEPDCGDGEPDCGDGEPDWGEGELDWGGGLPEPPVGVGGASGGWLWKSRMAISTASAASSSINSQETKIVRQPARS